MIASALVGCAASPAGHARAASLAPGAPALVETWVEAEQTVAVGPMVLAAGPLAPFTAAETMRCPADMALVGDRVCVDRFEAAIVQVRGGREVAWSAYASLDDEVDYRAVSREGLVPQGYVSGKQAERACRAAGKRLCTSGEWERSCRGPAGGKFPYGDTRRASACNDDVRHAHPVIEAASRAGIPRESVWTLGMNLPEVNQLPDSLARAGERAACVSAEGVHDMVGNLHEWVADADGTFRGGYYMDTTQNGEGCSYQTTAHDFDYHDYSTGFRCCRDADTIE